MHHLTIHRLYFTQSDCYKAGVKQKPVGVQVHSTGANNPYLRRYVGPDDGLLGENPNGNTHNRPGGNVCANAYIGKLADGAVAVYQTLPWDYRCWLSGGGSNGNANKLGYIGFEICEDNCKNREYFDQAVRGAAVLLTAHLCQMIGVTPWEIIHSGPAYAVMDHAELHVAGLASNHGDIGLWLKKFGYTFSDFRYWVQDAMDEGVDVTYMDSEVEPMDHPTLRRGDSGKAVTYLQTLLCDVGETLTVDGKFLNKTEQAVKDFQRLYGLTVDGVVGPKTWDALETETGHEDPDDVWDPEAPEIVTPPASPVPGTQAGDTVTISKSDWDAVRAAAAVICQTVKKYENVG